MNLKERLKKVSENNSAFIEVYGAMPRWRLKLKEVSELPDNELEAEVIKLEQALEAVNNKMAQEEINRKSQRTRALNKLKALGLTDNDLEALGL